MNCTVITTSSPILYTPLSEVDETETTDAGIPSTTMAFVFANEPDSPGVGNVNIALLLAASFIDPLFNANELFET